MRARQGRLPSGGKSLPRTREVKRQERRVGLKRQVCRSALNLVAVDPSLGKDGHRPALGRGSQAHA